MSPPIALASPKTLITTWQGPKFNFKIKGDGPITYHLGMDFARDESGNLCMQPRKYVEKMVDSYVRMFGKQPDQNVTSPLVRNDHPELDTTEELDEIGIKKYQSLIGSLQLPLS